MRLTNHAVETIQQISDYELRDGITLKIQALAPDYDDSVEAELPSPQPERLGVEKDGKGKVLMDESNRPVVRYKDQDPAYLKAVSKNGKLQAIKMLVDGLVPGEMDFDAKLDPDDPPAFYRAVLAELKAFGFTMGDLLGIVKAVGALSGIGDEEIKIAERDFSRAED